MVTSVSFIQYIDLTVKEFEREPYPDVLQQASYCMAPRVFKILPSWPYDN